MRGLFCTDWNQPSARDRALKHSASYLSFTQRRRGAAAEKALVRFEANPHHLRAKLVVLTAQDAAAVKAAEERQRPWAREMTAGLNMKRITAALEVLTHMDQHLSNDTGAAEMNANTERGKNDAKKCKS